MGDCTFCRIVAGDAEAHVVVDEAHAVAFLDRRPLFHGHCLLVPRDHRETLLDLDPGDLGPYFTTVQRLTAAVTQAMDAEGSFVAMNNRVSQSVPHLHTHVVPRRPKDGLRGFFWPRNPYGDDEQMARVAGSVRDAYDRLRSGP